MPISSSTSWESFNCCKGVTEIPHMYHSSCVSSIYSCSWQANCYYCLFWCWSGFRNRWQLVYLRVMHLPMLKFGFVVGQETTLVARSSTIVAYRSLSSTTSEVLWLQSLLLKLKVLTHTNSLLWQYEYYGSLTQYLFSCEAKLSTKHVLSSTFLPLFWILTFLQNHCLP